MNHTPELLEGPIAQEYLEILASVSSLEAAAKKKAVTGKGCSVPKVCPKERPNTGKGCSVPKVCPKEKVPTGKGCSLPAVCPPQKAEAFEHGVPAWSRPPAPPVA